VGVAEEGDLDALALDDERTSRLLEIPTGTDSPDTGLKQGRPGIQQSLALGVERMIVGRRHDVDSSPPQPIGKCGGPAKGSNVTSSI
jgi:hypothetical protein